MGRISFVICFIVALLTILSMVPGFLLLLMCEFAPGCVFDGFWFLVTGPVKYQTLASATVLGPPFFLFLYVLAFRSCHNRADVLDRSPHLFDRTDAG